MVAKIGFSVLCALFLVTVPELGFSQGPYCLVDKSSPLLCSDVTIECQSDLSQNVLNFGTAVGRLCDKDNQVKVAGLQCTTELQIRTDDLNAKLVESASDRDFLNVKLIKAQYRTRTLRKSLTRALRKCGAACK